MGDRIPQVLVVDDEPGICQLIRDALAPYGLQCHAVHTGHEARRRLLEGDIDVAVLDLALPDVSGLDLLELVFQHKLSTRVICISGVGCDDASALACRAGAWEFVRKPFDATELAKTIARAAGRSVPAQPRGQIDSPAVAGAPAGRAGPSGGCGPGSAARFGRRPRGSQTRHCAWSQPQGGGCWQKPERLLPPTVQCRCKPESGAIYAQQFLA